MRTTGKQGRVFRFFDTNSQIDYEWKALDTSKSGVEIPILGLWCFRSTTCCRVIRCSYTNSHSQLYQFALEGVVLDLFQQAASGVRGVGAVSDGL